MAYDGGSVYRTIVSEEDAGWRWRVEIDGGVLADPLADHRSWNGLAESRSAAFDEVCDRLGLIESLERSRSE